jgi:uncharacterized repeat protein (TIGR03803 family)
MSRLASLSVLRFMLILALASAVTTQSALTQTFTVLHTFTAGQDGAEPYAGLTMDRGGNLYGTALGGGCGFGTVFNLTHRNSIVARAGVGWPIASPGAPAHSAPRVPSRTCSTTRLAVAIHGRTSDSGSAGSISSSTIAAGRTPSLQSSGGCETQTPLHS